MFEGSQNATGQPVTAQYMLPMEYTHSDDGPEVRRQFSCKLVCSALSGMRTASCRPPADLPCVVDNWLSFCVKRRPNIELKDWCIRMSNTIGRRLFEYARNVYLPVAALDVSIYLWPQRMHRGLV